MRNRYLFLLIVICFSASYPAFAEKRVFEPYVTQGEWEYETTGLYDLDHTKNKNGVQEYKNAIGYGVSSFWATEIEIEMERESTNDGLKAFKATHMEWENIFQLAPKGKYWLDPGIYLAYEAPLINKQVGQFEGKILLEKNYQKISNALNISFNKEVGGGADAHTDGGVAWRTQYRLSRYFKPGVEYYVDFSAIDHHLTYNQQSHQVGPAFSGLLTRHIKYDIGYLFALSETAPRGEIKWVLEYEF